MAPARLCLHIGRALDATLRVLGHLRIEALLNLLEHVLVGLVADKADTQALGTESTSTADTVEVRGCISWEIIVDGQVDTLDINASSEDIGGDTDSLIELLEFFVAFDTGWCQSCDKCVQTVEKRLPFFLGDTRVNSDRWKVAFSKKLVEFGSS